LKGLIPLGAVTIMGAGIGAGASSTTEAVIQRKK